MNKSNISYDRFTKKELQERFERSDKHNLHMSFARQSFDQFIIQFYPSYCEELKINLNESASGGADKVAKQEVNDRVLAASDVSKSVSIATRKDNESHASLVQKPFNKNEYQRLLMQERRKKEKLTK